MQKPLCFALALCLTLNGCGVFRRSETWALVRGVRVDARGEADPSQAYAAELSARLAAANVEHKVVTYQFRYRTHLREEAIGTRTAVVYRDETRPANPWWLMEERLYQPVWLPSTDLDRQISFYLRDRAEVVETRDIPGGGGGAHKVMLATRRDVPTLVAGAPRTVRRPSLLVAFRASPARGGQLRSSVSTMVENGLAERERWFRAARFAGAAGAGNLSHADLPPKGDALVSSVFYARHGTAFDPLSPIDRRKMRQLRQARVVRGEKTARAF